MERRSDPGKSAVAARGGGGVGVGGGNGGSSGSVLEEHTFKDKIKTMFGLSSRQTDSTKSANNSADFVNQKRICPEVRLSLDLLKGALREAYES